MEGWQRELGVSVLIFDYPGYSRSGGKPTEAGCYAAAEAAYQWLTQVQGVRVERVLIYGRSLGTAVAVDLASRQPHRALVLVSPFTSLPDVVDRRYRLLPAQLLMHNRFASITKVGECKGPLLVVHGTADQQVPLALGKALVAAAPEPKRFLAIPGAGHGDCVKPAMFAALSVFLLEAERTPLP